jgi:hypothetical protein
MTLTLDMGYAHSRASAEHHLAKPSHRSLPHFSTDTPTRLPYSVHDPS